jgi:hypothetical protein
MSSITFVVRRSLVVVACAIVSHGCSPLGQPVLYDVVKLSDGAYAYFKSFDISRSAGVVVLSPNPDACAAPNPATDYRFQEPGEARLDIMIDGGNVTTFSSNVQPPKKHAFDFAINTRVVNNFEFRQLLNGPSGSRIRKIPSDRAVLYTCYW